MAMQNYNSHYFYVDQSMAYSHMTYYIILYNITVHCRHVLSEILFTEIPVITASEQEFNITEGNIITCTASGYPVPDIVWLNNDGSVVDKNRIKTDRAVATGVGNLSSVSVSMIIGRNDAGAYTCVAYNSIGNDTSTINITVNCKEL